MKGILFNTPMVKAILENRKRATRRTIKNICTTMPIKAGYILYDGKGREIKPKYEVGEVLYV